MDPSKFAEKPWDAWTKNVENLNNEQVPKVGVNKLPKENIKMFGVVVDSTRFTLIVCEVCDKVVKAEALLHHYTRRHPEALCKKPSPDLMEMEVSSEISTTTLTSDLENLHVCNKIIDDPSDGHVVNENIKGKTKLTSPYSSSQRRLKRLETNRPPLGLINRFDAKNKKSCLKNKLNVKMTPLNKTDVEKMETTEIVKAKDGLDGLLLKLPAMSLKSVKHERDYEDDKTRSGPASSQISFMSSPPRALSESPHFSCHRVAGLLCCGRQLKTVRESLQETLNDKMTSAANIFLQMKARRRNPYTRNKKNVFGC